MNKFFLLAGGAAMLLTTASCSSEFDESGNGRDGNVHFTVELPAQMRTRALADGTTASTLTYAVYESGSKTPVEVSEDKVTFDNLAAQIDLRLVNGKSYDIIFWADAPGQTAYTFDADTQQVSIDYSNVSGNDETRDAFFAATTLDVTGPVNKTVELYRPFAQVNLGTDDLNSAAAKAAYADGLQVALSTTAYNTLDLLTGEVSGETAVTFKAAPVTGLDGETFPYNPNAGTSTANPYYYIAMDYILVDSDKEVIDVEYTFYNGTVANQQTLPVSNVPVQRNYQTNIYGSLLTSPANMKIIISPAFTEPAYNQEVYTASTPAEFVDALNQAKDGDEIRLAEDMDMTDQGVQTIEKDITLTIPVGTVVTTARQGDTANFVVAEGAEVTLTGGGSFEADNRIIDVDDTLNVKGADFTTTTKTRGSAITVNPTGTVNFESGSITAANCAVWVEGAFVMNGGDIVSTSSSSDPETKSNFSYAVRAIDANSNIVINGGTVEGVQGAVGAYAGNITINGGTFITNPRVTDKDNYYALYVADNDAHAVVNGGYFYANGKADVYFVDNHATLELKGGTYEDQGKWVTGNDSEPTTDHGICVPAEGYEWKAIDDGVYKWTIVPVTE